MQAQSVANAVREAEKLVTGLAESPYRVAAFQVVFRELLLGSGRKSVAMPSGKATAGSHDGNGVRSQTQKRILELVESGFFKEPRLADDVRSELRIQGFHHAEGDVRMALLRLAQKRLLRRLHDGGKAYRYTLP